MPCEIWRVFPHVFWDTWTGCFNIEYISELSVNFWTLFRDPLKVLSCVKESLKNQTHRNEVVSAVGILSVNIIMSLPKFWRSTTAATSSQGHLWFGSDEPQSHEVTLEGTGKFCHLPSENKKVSLIIMIMQPRYKFNWIPENKACFPLLGKCHVHDTQKRDYMVEQSSFTLIALFGLEIGCCRDRSWRASLFPKELPKSVRSTSWRMILEEF